MATISPYKKGQLLHQFVFKKVLHIEELQCFFYELEHIASGACVLHIANNDTENVFCLGFQTFPPSSNGITHILEHTVLCGSKKYPIKDPFFSMARRSLNTFMNALTGADFTCYPAASQVEKDFYNLLDVYLDAVFHPLLNRFSFLQEGCRLEFEDPQNSKSPLVYKGIVFNEMKGSLSSPETRLWHLIYHYLTPDLPYAYNSGGDPKEIPNLTYEEFCKFHQTVYDPSRCIFYFYGNLPLEKHLVFLQDHLLKDAKKGDPWSALHLQKRFTAPISKIASYPTHEKNLSHKTFISFSWLTTHIKEQQDVLALSLLDSILLDTDASPLKRALLESGFCRQIDAMVDLEMSEIPINIICKGCEEAYADKLQKVLFDTLENIATKGLDKNLIESSLHQLEFSGTEISGDYYPFGLHLFFRSGLSKLHGCPPEYSLLLHSQFKTLLALTKDPTYLPKLIRRYFLDNPHFVRIVMKPDPELAHEEQAEELRKLSDIQKHLTKEVKEKLVQEAKELEDFQHSLEQEQLDCLPKIAIADIPKKTRMFDLHSSQLNHLHIFHHECFTNHIAYANCISSLPVLTEEELLYTKLFAMLIPEIGTKDRGYIQNLEHLHAYTGGISCSLGIHTQHRDPSVIKPAIHLKGKALSRNISRLFTILQDLMLAPRFDEKERIKELILQIFTEMHNRLNKSALSYAADLALSPNSTTTRLHHLWHGLAFYKFIEDLALNVDKKLPKVIDKLLDLAPRIFHGHQLDLTLSCSQEDKHLIDKHHFFGLQNISPRPYTPWTTQLHLEPVSSHARKISTPVAFSCMATRTVYTPAPLAPALSLAATIMQNKVLHKQIRETGGAYGAGAIYNGINGNFHMYSYRDPHIASTLKAFEEAIHTLASGHFHEQDLEEAKLGVIQQIDSPVPPGARANDTYVLLRENILPEHRQIFRDTILGATVQQVRTAVETHLNHFLDEGRIVVFASEDLIKKENDLLQNKLPILSV